MSIDSSTTKTILSKLALIEQHQRHQTQLIQHIMKVMQASDDTTCDLPDGVSLPLQNLSEVAKCEECLEDRDNARKWYVNKLFEQLFHIII